jgi:hypothetical protein
MSAAAGNPSSQAVTGQPKLVASAGVGSDLSFEVLAAADFVPFSCQVPGRAETLRSTPAERCWGWRGAAAGVSGLGGHTRVATRLGPCGRGG